MRPAWAPLRSPAKTNKQTKQNKNKKTKQKNPYISVAKVLSNWYSTGHTHNSNKSKTKVYVFL